MGKIVVDKIEKNRKIKITIYSCLNRVHRQGPCPNYRHLAPSYPPKTVKSYPQVLAVSTIIRFIDSDSEQNSGPNSESKSESKSEINLLAFLRGVCE